MLSGNIGEWSEMYTFLKLLGDGELYAADEKLNKIPSIYYPIISILRNETTLLEYRRDTDVKVISGVKVLQEVPTTVFIKKAEELLLRLNSTKKRARAFTCKDTEKFLNSIKILKIKSGSNRKEDITLIVHDLKTGLTPTLSFSIKSQLGGASTLLNPGNATNFEYRLISKQNVVREDTTEYVANSDEVVKLRERLNSKISTGNTLEFISTGNQTFTANMVMVDSMLPEILSKMLVHYYLGEANTIKELTEILETTNPMNFPDKEHRYYEHKIKKFLMDVALGMTPAAVWQGDYIASGGYIVVKPNGEILCYHIYNINQFQDYLFNNTKLDSPSTNRYDYGNFYSENSETRIKLNLQIRFIK